jgi:hypothetical protein
MNRVEKSLVGVVVAAGLLATGCGRKVRMTSASSVPAAAGVAKLTKDSNGNIVVDLKVRHLARPDTLTPPQSVYIVWIQPRGGQVTKQGELRVDDNLQGEFKTPAPSKNFDIFVTAESGPTVTQPTGPEVLRQTINES